MPRETRWVPATGDHELRLAEGVLECRDRQGRPVAPIPPQVLETRAYPAWALVHHPGDAEAALAASGACAAASGAEPHDAVPIYQAAARGLPSPHLPVFFEQAAGELAAGAVELGAKDIAPFAARLSESFPPDQALDCLAEVAARRADAGRSPWPRLPRQMSALAKAAARDELAEHRRLFERLPEPAVRQFPLGLWKTWRPTLVRVARDSPRFQERLLDLFPYADHIDGWWLDFLDECGALEAVCSTAVPEARPAGAAAAWLSRTVQHPRLNDTTRRRRDRVLRPLPPELLALIPRMSARLVADGVPVHLHGTDGSYGIDLRILEACLAGGVPVAPPGPHAGLALDHWLMWRGDEEDLPATAADPSFGPLLRAAATANLDHSRMPGVWTVPALRPHLPLPAGPDGPVPHPLDDRHVTASLAGLHETNPPWSPVRGDLYRIEVIAALLRDPTLPVRIENFLTGLYRLTGRMGAVALRAASSCTPEIHRRRLLLLLDVWSRTPFADPAARLRASVAATQERVVQNEHGTAVMVLYKTRDENHFLELRTGDGSPLDGRNVIQRTDLACGWSEANRLRALAGLITERGPVPWDPAAATRLAERVGIGEAAAALVLATFQEADGAPWPGEHTRNVLGLGSDEAERARAELIDLTRDHRLDLFANALPPQVADLWEPGAMITIADRVADAWLEPPAETATG
ncbi:hypothetical protein [Spirillospora sp. NPDC029432]|uniref:hypothetical protein n=1 Tax=Spirillospora sp. NPDC029432 TaxID=3154599 RepID=UPI003454A478